MKFSSFFFFLLFVSAIFSLYALMYQEGNQQFGEVNASSSEWNDSYDYVESLNASISPLEKKFKTIQDEDAGWFSKLTSGITAIPYAVIIFPQVVFGGLEMAGDVSMGFLVALAIPGYIISIILLGLLVWGVIKLVEQFNKYPT